MFNIFFITKINYIHCRTSRNSKKIKEEKLNCPQTHVPLIADTFMYLNHYKKETFIIEKKMYADGKKNPKQKKKKKKV